MINPWEKYFKNEYSIILDTCSLMDSGFTQQLFNSLVRSLNRYGQKVVVPEKVCKEIEHHLKRSETKAKASQAKKMIDTLNKKHLLKVDMMLHNQNTRYADNIIMAIVARDMPYKKTLLVSQDKNLIKAVLAYKDQQAVTIKDIAVVKISQGTIVDARANAHTVSSSKNNTVSKKKSKPYVPCIPQEDENSYIKREIRRQRRKHYARLEAQRRAKIVENRLYILTYFILSCLSWFASALCIKSGVAVGTIISCGFIMIFLALMFNRMVK